MVRISSMISTVLPTPAPPNIAALPPRASGASRSITLIPVWNNSRGRLWSASRGAAGGSASAARRQAKAGPWSTGSPSTLTIRPSTASPTGTDIGAPVLYTPVPRLRPAVPPNATVRTVAGSRCR